MHKNILRVVECGERILFSKYSGTRDAGNITASVVDPGGPEYIKVLSQCADLCGPWEVLPYSLPTARANSSYVVCTRRYAAVPGRESPTGIVGW